MSCQGQLWGYYVELILNDGMGRIQVTRTFFKAVLYFTTHLTSHFTFSLIFPTNSTVVSIVHWWLNFIVFCVYFLLFYFLENLYRMNSLHRYCWRYCSLNPSLKIFLFCISLISSFNFMKLVPIAMYWEFF